MKNKKTVKNRHEIARNAALRQIAECQPFIEGSLSSFKRKGCEKPGWHLTFKKRGRTQTVYVPMDMVEDVKKWTKEYQKLRRIIRTVTRHSLGIVRGYVANRSAAERAERLRIKKH
jgi:hypothetical protein